MAEHIVVADVTLVRFQGRAFTKTKTFFVFFVLLFFISFHFFITFFFYFKISSRFNIPLSFLYQNSSFNPFFLLFLLLFSIKIYGSSEFRSRYLFHAKETCYQVHQRPFSLNFDEALKFILFY